MKGKNIYLKWLLNLDVIISGIALVLLVGLTLIGALSRYFLDNPFTWMEEVQQLLEVWVVFLGAGYGFRTGAHVAIEIVIDALPLKMQHVFDIIIAVLVVVIISYLMYQSIGYFNLFTNSGRETSILRIPYSLIYGIVPISCLLMIANYMYVFIKKLQGTDIVEEAKAS